MKEDCAHRTDTKRTGSVMNAPPANVFVSVACDAASCCLHLIIVCSDGICREGTVRIASPTEVGRWISSAGEGMGWGVTVAREQLISGSAAASADRSCCLRFHC